MSRRAYVSGPAPAKTKPGQSRTHEDFTSCSDCGWTHDDWLTAQEEIETLRRENAKLRAALSEKETGR